jgi:hypothetical protein
MQELRAIRTRVAAAKPWVPWHLYNGCSSNHIGENPAIMRAARAALVALGEPEAPPFDETDEFASKRKDADLPDALQELHHHLTDWVFKRIVERKLRSPDVVRVGGEVLRDVFRYSADDEERSTADERTEGLTCMIFQGPPALPELATVVALPNMAGSDKTIVLYVMTIIADAPALFARLATATPEHVLAALQPTPENLATLDLVAGWALATLGDRAHAAIEAAFRWRFAMVEPSSDHWIENEPTANRLALLAATLPNGKALLGEVAKRGNYHVKELVVASRKPAGIAGMDGKIERTFEQQMKDGGAKYTCTIGVTGKVITIGYRAEDVYVQGILPDNRYEQSGTIAASSADLARGIADRVCQTLGAVGFVASVEPAPVKKPKKSKR